MDSTITSARRTKGADRGFTLAEVLIAAALSSFVLAAVMSSFLFLGRTGLRAQNLSEMEGEVRRALETFAQDVRGATNIRWHSAQAITLVLPSGAEVTYAYDADASSAGYRSLYRVEGAGPTATPRRILVRGLADDFTFRRYKLETSDGSDNAARTDLETKQIQIVMRAERANATTAGGTQTAASARYILRNKRVSN